MSARRRARIIAARVLIAFLCPFPISGDVPTKFRQNKPLGRWVSTQRALYKQVGGVASDKETQTRFARLEAIGFNWVQTIPHSPHDESEETTTFPYGEQSSGDPYEYPYGKPLKVPYEGQSIWL